MNLQNMPNLASAAAAQYGSTAVGTYLAQNQNVKAVADLNGYRVFINPALWGADGRADMATVIHELIHNATGLTDSDFERKLEAAGLGKDLSAELRAKCIT
jgi:TRAP-type uncharacterized transport system substrate-binding protein